MFHAALIVGCGVTVAERDFFKITIKYHCNIFLFMFGTNKTIYSFSPHKCGINHAANGEE